MHQWHRTPAPCWKQVPLALTHVRCATRRVVAQARDAFLSMLLESAELKTSHSYKRARELFEEDPRWGALPDREREQLFHQSQVRVAGRWWGTCECEGACAASGGLTPFTPPALVLHASQPSAEGEEGA